MSNMNNVISFTPAELAAFIGTIAGVCAGIATIVGIIVKVVMRLKAPEMEQNNRIKALEEENKSRKEEIEELKKRIGEGDDHFTELEKTNKVILRTLQALLNLSLGVSDTEALKKVSEDLNDFILNK
jgi:uncharacterized membrane-anchored protein YhcB (DUF1043 family)